MTPETEGTESPEERLLALIKQIGYGTLLITVRDGRPVEFTTELSGRLTKPLIPSQLALIAQSQSITE
jgi:hypothetical protein